MGEEESLAADVVAALERLGIPFMLVGAAALAVRGVTRGSHDIDFMTTEPDALSRKWASEIPEPFSFERFRGDHDDPLQGTIRFSRGGASPVDLVVGKWKWQREVIDRSEPFDLGSFRTTVPRTEDLVLLKVEAGSPLDHRDAEQLIAIHGEGLIEAVETRMTELPADLRKSWQLFRSRLE
jgi:hypothetical protein